MWECKQPTTYTHILSSISFILYIMYCKQCNEEKDEDKFPVNRSKTSGRGFYCNACMYARLKEWRSRNPEKVRSIQKRRYERLHGTSTVICPE